jgi:hypothetical protein
MTQRGQCGKWTENVLQMAVAAYGLNKCRRVHGVPKATIRRHTMKNWYVDDVKALGRKATFSGGIQQILADHIIMLQERFCGLSIEDVRKLAFQLVEKYKLPHTAVKRKNWRGKMVLCTYAKKSSAVRQPETTSLVRAKGFNRDNVLHILICWKAISQNLGLHLTRYST